MLSGYLFPVELGGIANLSDLILKILLVFVLFFSSFISLIDRFAVELDALLLLNYGDKLFNETEDFDYFCILSMSSFGGAEI